MFKTDNIQPLRVMRRRRLTALPSQSAYTARPIPPLIEGESLLPSSDRVKHTNIQTARRLHKPIFWAATPCTSSPGGKYWHLGGTCCIHQEMLLQMQVVTGSGRKEREPICTATAMKTSKLLSWDSCPWQWHTGESMLYNNKKTFTYNKPNGLI
jgi:hypothetical protein